MIDVYPVHAEESRVKFEPERINALLGTDLSAEEMLGYFERIDLRYDKEAGEIVAPTWRQDIHCMADLAEEVARFYGYDRIATTLPTARRPPESFLISFGWRRSPERWRNSAASPRE